MRSPTAWNRPGLFAVATVALAALAGCSDDAEPPTAPPVEPVDADNPDRQVLVAFYQAAGGPGWHDDRNWNSPSAIGTWYGVRTDANGSVTELDLEDNGLSGTLTPRLGELAQLRRLVLEGNGITGRVPPELGNLGNLTRLSLRRNSLEGPIPAELGGLAMLDSLDLFDTGVSGAIPPELGNLGALTNLALGWNELSGEIPPELGRLDNLLYMNLSLNQLTGTIPPELGDLDSIELLSVSRNDLTGEIPVELGQLETIERLYLYDNQLTGEIPAELGQLTSLDLLWIDRNALTGPIPDAFANLTALADLRAYDNRLSGALPSFLGGLPLRILYMHGNEFAGRVPREIGSVGTLEYVSLHRNPQLAGLLPRTLLAIEHLQRLTFEDTGLCPQVDAEFREWLEAIPVYSEVACDAAQVERAALAEIHGLTGGASWTNSGAWNSDAEVGSWHGVASEGGRVVGLSLPDNGLAGPLPGELANLTELSVLDVSGNDLAGPMPEAIAGLQRLTELRVGGNMRLEGALPFGLRRLEGLRVLDFDGTGLCASPSENFQAWLDAIPEAAGATCDNPDEVTVSLETVYLTQSIQTREGQVRLVANRDALLRAFVVAEEPRGYFEPEVVAVFTRFGDEVHRVAMTRDDNQIPGVVDEGDLALSYNAVVPAEVVATGLQMAVEVDPGGTLPLGPDSRPRFPPSASLLLDVVEVPPMHVTVVPVMTAEATDSAVLAWASDIDGDSPQLGLLRNSFPFSEFNASSHDVYVTSVDVRTTAGRSRCSESSTRCASRKAGRGTTTASRTCRDRRSAAAGACRDGWGWARRAPTRSRTRWGTTCR